MSWLLSIASFLGMLLSKLIPAIGAEIRKNNTVEYIGDDDETKDAIDSCVTDSNGRRLRDVHSDDSAKP